MTQDLETCYIGYIAKLNGLVVFGTHGKAEKCIIILELHVNILVTSSELN